MDRVVGPLGRRREQYLGVVSAGEVSQVGLRSADHSGEGNGRVRRSGPPLLPVVVPDAEGELVRACEQAESRPLRLDELGESYRRYRLADPAAEEAMARSLRQYGQLTPATACWRPSGAELVDGFKRRVAAQHAGWKTLSVCVVEMDERRAKAALYGLNRSGRPPSELEEAWIVQALVREDGLSQVEVAELLDRHKSWVCRRLALLERLCEGAQSDLRLGLLSPGLARQLTRLPMGNQSAVLTSARRASLTTTEVQGVIDLLQSATPEQEALVLQDPRRALLQATNVPLPARDPRLTPSGNRLARQLNLLLDLLERMENWLHHPGLAELKRDDRRILGPRFGRLAGAARTMAASVQEVWAAAFEEAAS